MNKAFIMIISEIGLEDLVLEKLKSIKSIKMVQRLCGVYDLAIKVEELDHDSLREVIAKKIRNLEGIRSTLTLLIV